MKIYLVSIIAILGMSGLLKAEESGKHLFILSGQSNMARFKPKSWFTPGISEALGANNVIVSFQAKGGQLISKWYKQWKSSKGEADPYRWLESDVRESDETRGWVDAQNRVTFGYLEGLSEREAIRERLTE